MEGKRGSECLLKSVSNIDFNPRFSETEMPTLFAPFSNQILLMSAEPIAVVKGWGFPNILEAYKT
ncbi:hypothetical protein ACA574_17450, partial [Lactiplantibacillus plantarum]